MAVLPQYWEPKEIVGLLKAPSLFPLLIPELDEGTGLSWDFTRDCGGTLCGDQWICTFLPSLWVTFSGPRLRADAGGNGTAPLIIYLPKSFVYVLGSGF